MKYLIIISAIMILLAPVAGFAANGFVIEANSAQPEVGIQVHGDTLVSVNDGGHIVLMTEAGQMVRKDGPFTGTADDILGGQIGSAETAMEGSVLGSLLELAEVSGKSDEELGAVRGTTQEGAERPDTISTAVSNFCLSENQNPVFYTTDAPVVDEPLILRRRVRPIQFLQTTWPAGANSLAWPADWPPAEDGRYVWALGSRGTVALRIIALEEVPHGVLAAAALQYDLGCEVQAKGLFESALAAAQGG